MVHGVGNALVYDCTMEGEFLAIIQKDKRHDCVEVETLILMTFISLYNEHQLRYNSSINRFHLSNM